MLTEITKMSQIRTQENFSISQDIWLTAEYMAEQLARGFRAHDKGHKQKAVRAFYEVDRRQFHHVDEQDAQLAAEAFVDALWAKDDVELQYLKHGTLDQEGIENADYGRVRQKLRERAVIIGAEQDYAMTKAEAWRRHKAGGDYWTPFQQSQIYELRAALQDPEYPRKPRAGQSGPGPEPQRYVLAFELHDMHDEQYWTQGEQVMVPYFTRILQENRDVIPK